MSLPIPFSVYGTVTKGSGSPISGASVSIVDLTDDQGTLNVTTDGDGKYVANVRNYVSIGDTIQVTAQSTIYSSSDTFTLSLIPPSQQVDFSITFDNKFSITGDSTIVDLTMPSTLVEVTSENVGTLVFSDNSYVAHHTGRSGEQLVLGGLQYGSDVYTKMASIRAMMDNHEEVTIAGLPDGNMNSIYRIANLRKDKRIANSIRVRYMLILERKQEGT